MSALCCSAAPLDRQLHNQWTEDCTKLFACAAQEFAVAEGATAKHNSLVAYKNHRMSINNPNAMLQKEFSLAACGEGLVAAPPLTRLQCAAMADGSAAVLLVTESFLNQRPQLQQRAVEVIGMCMVSHLEPVASSESCMELCGRSMARVAAERAMAEAKVCCYCCCMGQLSVCSR